MAGLSACDGARHSGWQGTGRRPRDLHATGSHTRSPEAITNNEGRYALQLAESLPGAPSGRYLVQVEHLVDGHDVIPAKFGTKTRTTRVVSAERPVIDLELLTTAKP